MAGIKVRPPAANGITYRVKTPMGTAYITINRDEKNEPIEVFTNVGKAGSDTAAISEAIGRLISLCLRLPSSMSAADRAAEVIDQLAGIGGGRHVGFGTGRIKSLPDAVARILSENLGLNTATNPEPESIYVQESVKIGDLCPKCGNATLVHQEGCQKCYSCGFSEC